MKKKSKIQDIFSVLLGFMVLLFVFALIRGIKDPVPDTGTNSGIVEPSDVNIELDETNVYF